MSTAPTFPNADYFSPDGSTAETALSRTTHLCIAAHQDDAEIMAYHGIAECYNSQDRWFTAVIASDGAGSPRSGTFAHISPDELIQLRRLEQHAAAKLGRYSAVLQLGYSSAEIRNPSHGQLVQDLTRVLQATRPRFVYLHNPADKHDTHVALLLRCISALRSLKPEEQPEKVYGCEVWRDLDWLSDDLKVALRTDTQPELAEKLISVFRSQIDGGKRYDLAAIGRRLANATFSQPRETDAAASLTWAMDLTPLLKNSDLTVAEFTKRHLDTFQADVQSRIQKLS